MSLDLFYDPFKCKPFYRNTTEPVWLGRVQHLKRENQHILIYGFVATDESNQSELLGQEFEFTYEIHVRGKASDEEEWYYMNSSTNTVKTKCKEGHDLCTYFPVGFVPFIEYDMYDVMIVISPSEILESLTSIDIDFHIAYLHPKFTKQQLILRLTFTFLTAIIFFFFAFKVASILSFNHKEDVKKMPFETISTLALLFLLLQFDDPYYYAHVYKPSFFTYAITEFGIAIFVSGLLVFWIRDIARYRNKKLDDGASKAQKFIYKSMGMNNCILLCLGLFYIALTLCFMALYCTFYITVEGNPGAGELSVNQEMPNTSI